SPALKRRPFLSRHVANEGIREWFVRENWLLTEREVQRLLTLRRSVAAHYYDEGASPTPACRIRWSDASTRSGTSRGARCLDLSVIAGEAPRNLAGRGSPRHEAL